MKTQIKKTGDVVIVNLDGRLEFDTYIPLRERLEKLIDEGKTDSASSKVIFNLEKLEFVGSSGISAFINVLKEFSSLTPTRPRYCHVKSEFQRVFQAFDEEAVFQFHDTEEGAKKSFDH